MAGVNSSDARIAAGTSLSTVVDLNGAMIGGILVPAAWTAAAITFQASIDGSNFFDVFDSAGAETTIASANVVASRFVLMDIRDFAGVRFLRLRSGTAAVPVNQAADRVLRLPLRVGG